MKKGERVLCLKRQRSNILGFQLTDILSIRSEYLSKKKPKTKTVSLQGTLFLLVCLVGFYIWARYFISLG